MKPTKAHAAKVLELVNAGLVSGMGEPTPGKMCVEAAVCFALGEPHGDKPSCVGEAVRRFKIGLNDARWSSNEARTEGMREIAIAQLGSDTIDQAEFSRRLVLRTIQTFVPIALRAIVKFFPEHAEALELAAKACEVAGDMAAARLAANSAKAMTQKLQYAAAAYAAAYAAYAAANAAYAADAAAYAAAAYAADAAAYAADAYAYAAANAVNAAANAANAARNAVLQKAADMGVAILKELQSPGVKWLGLIRRKA